MPTSFIRPKRVLFGRPLASDRLDHERWPGAQACCRGDLRDKLGQVNNLVQRMDDFGTQREVYNGVDFNLLLALAGGQRKRANRSRGSTSHTGAPRARLRSGGAVMRNCVPSGVSTR